MIDYDRLQIIISLIKDFVTIFSTIVLAVIAVIGLQTWKKQLVGKTEYELARRLLRAVYKVRDAIRFVRNPFASASEISMSLQEANVEIESHDPEFHAKSQSALYQRRWKRVQDALTDLDLEEFEAEVIWGNEIRERILILRQQVGELLSHVELYIRSVQSANTTPFQEKMAEKVDEVIYDFHNLIDEESENTFTLKTVEAIKQIEIFIKPYMKP